MMGHNLPGSELLQLYRLLAARILILGGPTLHQPFKAPQGIGFAHNRLQPQPCQLPIPKASLLRQAVDCIS